MCVVLNTELLLIQDMSIILFYTNSIGHFCTRKKGMKVLILIKREINELIMGENIILKK